MRVATAYLNRRVLGYFGLCLLVFAGLLLGLDLLENGEDVMAADARAGALARYALLRLPTIGAVLVPIAALLAGLITVETLRRHRELIALWSIGMSPWRIMASLMPAGLLLLGLQFALDDRLVPLATADLRAWGVGPYEGRAGPDTSKTVWLLSGDHVLRVPPGAAAGGDVLHDITLFRRDQRGDLLERLDVRTARREDGTWRLYDVVRRSPAHAGAEVVEEMAWPHPIRLDVVAMLAVDPEELPLSVISVIIANDGFGQFPTDVYRTWFHHRLANALSPLMMLMLAVSLARSAHMRRGPGPFLVAGLALGFGYFIYDGVVLAIGKAGWLPGWLASWSPKAVMACVIGFLALRA